MGTDHDKEPCEDVVSHRTNYLNTCEIDCKSTCTVVKWK